MSKAQSNVCRELAEIATQSGIDHRAAAHLATKLSYHAQDEIEAIDDLRLFFVAAVKLGAAVGARPAATLWNEITARAAKMELDHTFRPVEALAEATEVILEGA